MQYNPNTYQLGEQSVFMGNDKAGVRLHARCSDDKPREPTDGTALMLSMISPIPIKERNSPKTAGRERPLRKGQTVFNVRSLI